jgi:hypothetical protein
LVVDDVDLSSDLEVEFPFEFWQSFGLGFWI